MNKRKQSPGKVGRRAVLLGAVSAAGAGMLRTSANAMDTVLEQPEPTRAARSLGRLPSDLGHRSPFEQPRRILTTPAHSGSSRTPIHLLRGILTPSDLHFERHHAGIPDIDPADYKLLIHVGIDHADADSVSTDQHRAAFRLEVLRHSNNLQWRCYNFGYALSENLCACHRLREPPCRSARRPPHACGR